MFPIRQNTLPSDAAGLQKALEESLREVVTAPAPMIKIEDRAYPELAEIRILLHEASFSHQLPPTPSRSSGITEAALQVDHFELLGQPVFVQEAAIDLTCTARDLCVGQVRDRNGDLVLLLQSAAEGHLEVKVDLADLERLVSAAITAEAGKHGVTIEAVQISLRSVGERSLEIEVRVRARKLFLNAAVRIAGRLEIDQQMTARLSDLICEGEGPLGSIACGLLDPHLRRFDGREFPATLLPLGDLQLRDVRIAVGRKVELTADFGGGAV